MQTHTPCNYVLHFAPALPASGYHTSSTCLFKEFGEGFIMPFSLVYYFLQE